MSDEHTSTALEKRGQLEGTPTTVPKHRQEERGGNETVTRLYSDLMDVDIEGGKAVLIQNCHGDYQVHDLVMTLQNRRRELQGQPYPIKPIGGSGATYLFEGSVLQGKGSTDLKGVVIRSTVSISGTELQYTIPGLKDVDVQKGLEADPLYELTEVRNNTLKDPRGKWEGKEYPDNVFVTYGELAVPELRKLIGQRGIARRPLTRKQEMIEALEAHDREKYRAQNDHLEPTLALAGTQPQSEATPVLTAQEMHDDIAAMLGAPADLADSALRGRNPTESLAETYLEGARDIIIPFKTPRSPSAPEIEPLSPRSGAPASSSEPKQGRKRGGAVMAEGEFVETTGTHAMRTRSKKARN
ncbi:hypothetical protein H2203_000391 [Taxawa tesnikishii (nom. ined.)]|nr:hypothetical protein H2203_000391 [Dothideales sp. JES 119]